MTTCQRCFLEIPPLSTCPRCELENYGLIEEVFRDDADILEEAAYCDSFSPTRGFVLQEPASFPRAEVLPSKSSKIFLKTTFTAGDKKAWVKEFTETYFACSEPLRNAVERIDDVHFAEYVHTCELSAEQDEIFLYEKANQNMPGVKQSLDYRWSSMSNKKQHNK